jgi:hypothetical protein
MTPGKRALTDTMNAGYLGEADYYTRAVDSAMRELDAIRSTVLPAYVAIHRKQNVPPLAKQIELANAAMRVRHMILSANAHVFALEQAATHRDPMVLWLRARIERVVAQATKLGIYQDAMDMRPRRYVEDIKLPPPSIKRTPSAPPTRKPANTTLAPAAAASPIKVLGKPPWSGRNGNSGGNGSNARIRPGFRGSAP